MSDIAAALRFQAAMFKGDIREFYRINGIAVHNAIGEMLNEIEALRASQPSEETKATVLGSLRAHRATSLPTVRAALAELERMGWK